MTFSRVAPWMFAVTSIPYGVVGAFATTIMPFILRRAGISVEEIGWFSVAIAFPVFAQFIYTPLIDFKFHRTLWLLLSVFVSAACIFAALFIPLPERASLFLILTFAAQLAGTVVGGCNGGLMAILLNSEEQAKASGWHSFGILGGGAVGVGVILYLVGKTSLYVIGGLGAILIIVPALLVLFFPKPQKVDLTPKATFRTSLLDLRKAIRTRLGWSGVLLCLSPVGTVALTNGFASIAQDYHAGSAMVAFVNGAMNAVVIGLGALIAGRLNRRYNRRKIYLLTGLLTALVGIAMACAPTVPTTYAIGVIAYFFVAGIANASFYGVVLETISHAGAAVSTYYTLFTSVANFATTYVIFINTRYHHLYGPKALLASDAILNLAGVLFLSLLMGILSRLRIKNREVSHPVGKKPIFPKT